MKSHLGKDNDDCCSHDSYCDKVREQEIYEIQRMPWSLNVSPNDAQNVSFHIDPSCCFPHRSSLAGELLKDKKQALERQRLRMTELATKEKAKVRILLSK